MEHSAPCRGRCPDSSDASFKVSNQTPRGPEDRVPAVLQEGLDEQSRNVQRHRDTLELDLTESMTEKSFGLFSGAQPEIQ